MVEFKSVQRSIVDPTCGEIGIRIGDRDLIDVTPLEDHVLGAAESRLRDVGPVVDRFPPRFYSFSAALLFSCLLPARFLSPT